MRGPGDRGGGRRRRRQRRRQRQWEHGLGGCESGFTAPDPADPNIVWATCYGNKVTRYDDRTKIARSVAPGMITLDAPPQDAKYRCHWTAPLAIDPFDHNNVYYGCKVIFQTNSGGQSWSVISPDLSTQDPSRIVSSGGIVGDNLGQFAARWSSRSRRRGAEGADLGRHQRRQGLEHARRRPEMERRDEEHHRAAGVGRDLEDRAVALRCRHGLRRGRRAPDGQPRAVHLQDDRLRRDLEEGQRRPAERHPLSYVQAVARTRTRPGCSSPAPATASTTRPTTAGTGRSWRPACRRAGELDRGRRRRSTTS